MEHDEEDHNASAKSGAKYRASIHHQGDDTEGPEKMVSLTSNDSSDEKHESFSPQQYETNTVTADHHQPDKAENRGTELSSTLIEPFQEDEICGMKKKYYGTKSDKKEKVIILVGAKGSGKTTLVNYIANYFQGNKKADGELVHVARCSNDDHSFTKTITAYTFCDHQDHTPITVIDTPGLDDSSGAEIRDHVLSIKTFLANIASHDYEIHAIGFVAQAHLVRLTSSERLVMNHVSTLFGEASGDHILTFITFSDSQSNPPIVEAMAYYGVKCKLFLRFNNSVLTMKTGDEIDELDQIYWNMGSKSWKKCMKVLEEMPPLSVHTMKTLQHSVYVSQVYDSVKKNLKSELKAFINTTNIHKGMMNKDAINVCESVWQLAIVVNYHSNKQSNKTHFVDTLLHYTQEVCQEARANEYNCVKLLSLAPSRELVNKGVGILEYNAPVYNICLEQQHNYAEKPPSTGRNISLYCKNFYTKDGGLYVPEEFPKLTLDELKSMAHTSYPGLVFEMARKFISEQEISSVQLKDLIDNNIKKFTTPEVVEIKQLNGELNIVELFHGPTLAFKDLALSVVGGLLNFYLKENQQNITILVGTSGDTGSSALMGVRGEEHTDIVVLLPHGRCTRTQELQMTTIMHDNVHIYRVEGNSDELDEPIKKCFRDESFVANHNLISINSINWGRVMVQIALYFYSYFRLCGEVGEVVQLLVPTGAAGNITAGCIAQKMGLPITMVATVNTNDIVARTLSCGDFSVKGEVVKSLAPAMDIQVPYNIERLLYLFTDQDRQRVRCLMEEFERENRVRVPEDVMTSLKQTVVGE
ncbi:hypothetical protein Pmani_021781 [Petrolisthes manimaculis]|uniref:Threonine synthase-like 2 n=1 Tax=Petrolisthes manimaculis TaxID=1843537 RepID=A0AAE1PFD3_9EUCA|nr:hypothetical protein Pmani_021781 [Petrolisthes manimaculis]